MAVLVGLQASGKTTFYEQCLRDRYSLVSKDLFPRGARNKQARQMRLVAQELAAARSVAVDNTNPSPEEWRPLVEAGHTHGAVVVAYWFPPDLSGSLRRNATRTGRDRVPDVALHATLKRLRRPSPGDGFDAVLDVRFDGRGGFEVRSARGERPQLRLRHAESAAHDGRDAWLPGSDSGQAGRRG
ncbi:AAA family ATPase [Streptomyces sp. S.PNR 29]|uniref:AAA family ATPase n=1 Tax=Streptomyces sp. S.PNR 29 TaxID=2973805 RepID=UPI0025B1A25B|nr:AAA family ATPase [Streptomyces sp. S.PNR 29]MDN0196536.1 ATP-binding protein [Streptomyces sp. S.PNR 29]